MSNMSYCKFRNTLNDLRDCARDWDCDSLEEKEARLKMLLLCIKIVNENGECRADYEEEIAELRASETA